MGESIAALRCAGLQEAVLRLALFLHAEAGTESVRTREAIAATIANQVDALAKKRVRGTPSSIDWRSLRAKLFVECLDQLRSAEARQPAVDEPAFASCWRIANRAVSGALQDPTGGAVRCHELGSRPCWATGLNPSAYIGSYLFYDDRSDEEADRKLPADGEAAF